MNMPKHLFTICGIALTSMLGTCASAQTSEAAARQQARDIVRSKLNLRAEQFLNIQRDEELEQSLAVSATGRIGPEFIYRLSSTGYEFKENAIVNHFSTEGESLYIIVVSPSDGSTYRIRGFSDSLGELEKLMTAVKMKVLDPNQAEAVADFYRKVNPENRSLTPISSIFDLKLAAERQCHTIPFDDGEREFDAWWKEARPLYAEVPFSQTSVTHGSGYLVEWIVLSSAAPGGPCGGAPLRARLEVSPDAHIGRITFSPVRKGQ
ncbi:MAG: hypothetical protein ABSC08_07815 [Bryobacteraceae bacterium]|jgi:hypothetical protein